MKAIPRDLGLRSHLLDTSCSDSFLELPPGMDRVPDTLLLGTDGTAKLGSYKRSLFTKSLTAKLQVGS